jgi:response regulator RpfG family c-di-GMP phosphodiesterase
MESPSSAAAAAVVPIDVVPTELDDEARAAVERCLSVAREQLGMDIGWLAEFCGDRKVFRVVEGATEEWDLESEDWIPLAQSYCKRMYDGQIPNAIPDTAAEPAVAQLEVTRTMRIGAYIGVPIVLEDGTLRGAFCCARHGEHPGLDDRDVRFMQVLARLIADDLAFRATLREMRRVERQASSTHALLAALEARDDYTGGHSHSVVDLARGVGQRLGLAADEQADLERVALLHDIGKVGVADAILRKPGPLDDDEWEIMKRHPTIGGDLIATIPELAHLAPAVAAEHERWDGRGYPQGLAGEQIPVTARITFVCDGYHAMVSDRPYRSALSQEDAVAELRRCRGTMFWPAAVDALLAELGADATPPER